MIKIQGQRLPPIPHATGGKQTDVTTPLHPLNTTTKTSNLDQAAEDFSPQSRILGHLRKVTSDASLKDFTQVCEDGGTNFFVGNDRNLWEIAASSPCKQAVVGVSGGILDVVAASGAPSFVQVDADPALAHGMGCWAALLLLTHARGEEHGWSIQHRADDFRANLLHEPVEKVSSALLEIGATQDEVKHLATLRQKAKFADNARWFHRNNIQKALPHLTRLLTKNRWTILTADLADSQVPKAVSRALDASGHSVGVVYLSNALDCIGNIRGVFSSLASLPLAETAQFITTRSDHRTGNEPIALRLGKPKGDATSQPLGPWLGERGLGAKLHAEAWAPAQNASLSTSQRGRMMAAAVYRRSDIDFFPAESTFSNFEGTTIEEFATWSAAVDEYANSEPVCRERTYHATKMWFDWEVLMAAGYDLDVLRQEVPATLPRGWTGDVLDEWVRAKLKPDRIQVALRNLCNKRGIEEKAEGDFSSIAAACTTVNDIKAAVNRLFRLQIGGRIG